MKKLLLPIFIFLNISVFCQVSSFSSKTADYGIAVGAWFGGEVSLADLDADIDKETGLLLQAFADFYLMEKLAMGVYVNYSNASFEETDETTDVFEIGGSIKPRFILSGGSLAIKPGLQIGYRTESIDIEGAEDIMGLGVNVSVEFQFATESNITPFGVIGFLSQPAGGNDDTDVTFGPIFYLGAGVAF